MADRKAVMILGARQVGKTSLLTKLQFEAGQTVLVLNADDLAVRDVLTNVNLETLKSIIGNKRLIIIDEAQRVINIGLILKMIVDQIPNVKVIASGSSSFELANKINEPLTGRKWEFKMYPLSWFEMVEHHGLLAESQKLQERLIFGYYPEIVSTSDDKEQLLMQLSDSYLYKDILNWESILKPQGLERLIKAIALQVGQLVSYHELAQISGLSSQTVERYIGLLEKSYILFRLGGFKRNIRAELNKSRKIYFYDNGIRNAIISNFNRPELRNDIGALWENFLISERIKKHARLGNYVSNYFWRTKEQSEIDYIEEGNGEIKAFEFSYKKANKRFNPSFLKQYNPTETSIIHSENFISWIS